MSGFAELKKKSERAFQRVFVRMCAPFLRSRYWLWASASSALRQYFLGDEAVGSHTSAELPLSARTGYYPPIVDNISAALTVNTRSDNGQVMGYVLGFCHISLPIHGVQFHPKRNVTEYGHALLTNFLAICGFATRQPA